MLFTESNLENPSKACESVFKSKLLMDSYEKRHHQSNQREQRVRECQVEDGLHYEIPSNNSIKTYDSRLLRHVNEN